MAQFMPLPLTVSCFGKIQMGFTFLVPSHLGSPGKRAVIWVCVCVVLAVIVISLLDNSLQMSVSCETPCYQEKRLSVLVSNSFPEAGHFRVLLIEVSGGFPGYGAPVESISKPQGMCTES